MLSVNYDNLKKYAGDKSIIDKKITYLETNGVYICENIYKCALSILNCQDEQERIFLVNKSIEEIMDYINSIYADNNCDPVCGSVPKPKCLNCNICKPECTKFNPSCYKCNRSLLTFNNGERLRSNKNSIRKYLENFLSGNNQISGNNTLS